MEGPRAEAWTPARTPPRHVRTCWPSSLPVGQPQPFRVVTGRLALGWPGSSPRPSPCHLRVPVFSWSIVSFVPGVGSVTLGAQRVTLSVPGPRLRSSATPGPRGFAGPPAACAGLSEGAPQGFGVTVRSRASGEQPGRLPFLSLFRLKPSVRRASLALSRVPVPECRPLEDVFAGTESFTVGSLWRREGDTGSEVWSTAPRDLGVGPVAPSAGGCEDAAAGCVACPCPRPDWQGAGLQGGLPPT